MSSKKIRVIDGFMWLVITARAKELFIHGLFELYILHDDSLQIKIEGLTQLIEAIDNGKDIVIEIGLAPQEETQMDLQREVIEKSGINIVTCGDCAEVLLHRLTDKVITCPYCELSEDPCHFPDLNT